MPAAKPSCNCVRRKCPSIRPCPAPPVRAGAARVEMIATGMRIGWVLLITLVLVLRQVRAWMSRASEIEISYLGGAMVRVMPGTSVLEASRMNGIAHYSICGVTGAVRPAGCAS